MCIIVQLFVAQLLALMPLARHQKQKEQELTSIEVMAGVGKRLQLYMMPPPTTFKRWSIPK